MLRVVLLTEAGSDAGSAAVGVKPKENVPELLMSTCASCGLFAV